MSKFGDAFASARKAGKKTFMHNGKSYTTKTKEEAAPPKPVKRSMKGKVSEVKPTGKPSAYKKVTQLKGKVPQKPGPHTKGGNTGDKTKAGANRTATYLKRKKALGN